MLAKESLSISIPPGFLGAFVGLAFGFVIGLFYYQAYRKPYYWAYSILSSMIAAIAAPFVMHYVLRMDPTTLHAIMVQFAVAFVAAILTNHVLYALKKRKKLHRRRRTAHTHPDLQVVTGHRHGSLRHVA